MQKLVISSLLFVCNAVKNTTFFRKPFMAMLISALASFSIATELPSESSYFDCKRVVETKNPYWPCAGLKVNFRKVSREAASEASKKICCYQAGKCMNSKIAFTECEDLKNSWSFPSKSRLQSRKNCSQCLAMFTNCFVNLMDYNVNVNANCKQ